MGKRKKIGIKTKVIAAISLLLFVVGGFLGMDESNKNLCIAYFISPFICSLGFFIEGMIEWMTDKNIAVKGIGVYIMFVLFSFGMLFFEFSHMFLWGRIASVIGATLLLTDIITKKDD